MQTAPELFLPEPSPREVRYTVISVDDHVVEPADMFEGRIPAHLADRAPRIVETPEGHQVWEFDGAQFSQVGMNAVAGRRPETVKLEPFRFEQMRPGCYDVHARVRDMDINGVWASLNFPSMITGFCGRVFFNASDRDVGVACVRAWNDWLFEEWYTAFPERIIPLGITYLADPEIAAARDPSQRGAWVHGREHARAPAHDRAPVAVGPRPLGSRSSARASRPTPSSRCTSAARAACPLRPAGPTCSSARRCSASSRCTRARSGCGRRTRSTTPTLKIAMSEGGIGWVPMLLDRLDNIIDRSGYGLGWDDRPADVLRRNFWFCTIDDPSTIDARHRIGVENIMVETDYPHGDGTWPDTQLVIEKYWGHIPNHELRAMCSENAAALYRHPLPDVVLPR